jgi:FixJ family two-component response regulator
MAAEPDLRDVPVVVVSADPHQRASVQRAGHDFLEKPAPTAALVAAIEKHCRRHV